MAALSARGAASLARFDSLAALARERYACKALDPARPLEEGALRACLEVAQRAPTSFNTQPWCAVVVQAPEARRALAKGMMAANGPRVETAPTSVVFCGDLEPQRLLGPDAPAYIAPALDAMIDQAGGVKAWSLKQGSLAAATFMLACTARGIQTCPMEGFDSAAAVADAIGLPARYLPFMVISCGYELEPRKAVSQRRDFADVIFQDSFGNKMIMD